MNHAPSVLVLGTVALDKIKTPSGQTDWILGGSAVHFSLAARIFSRVSLVAAVGEDFPQRHISFLQQKGLDISSLIRGKGQTFKWEGSYEGDLNTALTLNTHLGVLADFRPQISRPQSRIKYVFLANVDPDIQSQLLAKMRSVRLVGMDSMNYWINHQREKVLGLLKRVDIFLANEQEAKSLTAEVNLLKAARRLRSFGPAMVLIKKGEHGSLFYSDKFTLCLPAYPADKVIDPTGAGDTFAGAFMGYLAKAGKLNAQSISRAIALGTIAASFNVQGFGVQKTAGLEAADLFRRLKQFRSYVRF
jgi:sugar/nucleoside kinase (ribokinase family)